MIQKFSVPPHGVHVVPAVLGGFYITDDELPSIIDRVMAAYELSVSEVGPTQTAPVVSAAVSAHWSSLSNEEKWHVVVRKYGRFEILLLHFWYEGSQRVLVDLMEFAKTLADGHVIRLENPVESDVASGQ